MDKCLSLFLSPEPHFTPVYTQNAVTPLMVLIVKCLGFLHISLPDTVLVHNSEVLSWCQSGITVQSFESWQPKNPSLHAPPPSTRKQSHRRGRHQHIKCCLKRNQVRRPSTRSFRHRCSLEKQARIKGCKTVWQLRPGSLGKLGGRFCL